MAFKRRFIGETYHPSKRTRTRAQTQAATSFWRLPREVRDIIYGFIFGSPLTPLDTLTRQFGVRGAQSSGLGPASKRMHAEVTQHIIGNVEVQICANHQWDERSKRLLATCQRLMIIYDPHRHSEGCKVWQKQLAAAISDRADLKTFCLKGSGEKMLGYLTRPIRDDPFGIFSIVDLLAFERIMIMLSTFPKIRAKESVKVTWSGDSELPKHEQYVDEYRRMVKRIEQGLGGSKDGLSICPRFKFETRSYEY